MSALILPRRFTSQPQGAVEIDRTSRLGGLLVSAHIGDLSYDVATQNLPQLVGGIVRSDAGGVLRYFGGSAYLRHSTSLGGVDLAAVPDTRWSIVVFGRTATGAASGTYVAKCDADSGELRTFQLYTANGVNSPAVYLRGGSTALNWGFNDAKFHQMTITWDGTYAKAYGDATKYSPLIVGSAAVEASSNIIFGARSNGAGYRLLGDMSRVYIFNDLISLEEHLSLLNDPWQIFKAKPNRLYLGEQSIVGTPTLSLPGVDQITSIGARPYVSLGA